MSHQNKNDDNHAPVDYRPDIDGLRAVAVLAVLAFHGFPALVPGGFVGVDVFFVISGYLISGILLDAMDGSGRLQIARFYSRRIRRIFPALLVVLVAVYALGFVTMLVDEFRNLGKHVFASAFFVSNLLSWSENGYFDAASETKPLLHLWSLGVEEQFYIVWPLLLWLAARGGRARLLPWLLALSGLSFVAGVVQARFDFDGSYYLPLARFWELSSGGVLAWWSRRPGARLPASGGWRDLASLVGLALIVLAMFGLSRGRAAALGGLWPLAPTLGAVLLVAAGPGAVVNRRLLSRPVMIWFGLISYPLYLWHWPALVYLDFFSGRDATPMLRLLALATSVGLAWLTWRLVETPLRGPGRTRGKIIVSSIALAVVGTLGLATYLGNGLAWRRGALSPAISEDLTLPRASRKPDGSCAPWAELGLAAKTVCISKTSAPEILVLGDSHAMSLASAALVGRVEANVMLLAEHACLPDSGFGSAGCQALPALAAAILAKTPSLRVVEVSFSYSYIEHVGAQAYARALQRVIAALAPSGREIVIVLDAPKLDEDVHYCVRRRLSIGDGHARRCVVPMQDALRRQATYRATVHEVVAGAGGPSSRVRVFDSFPSLCDGADCRGLHDGTLYYFDNSHLSISGSQKVLDRLFARPRDGSGQAIGSE